MDGDNKIKKQWLTIQSLISIALLLNATSKNFSGALPLILGAIYL